MKLDARYTISRECTGKPRPQYVARFAGERLGEAATRNEARTLATNHRFDQCVALGFDLRATPALSYHLAGAESVKVSARRNYLADLATNQPDWQARRAVFISGILLTSGEYFVCR